MNIGASVLDIPIPIHPETDTSGARARAGQRRVIDLEPIASAQAPSTESKTTAVEPTDDHRGRIINLWA